jgi:hypothetical protein
MSTDQRFVCFTCKSEGPLFASGSGAYGYKVWQLGDDDLKWFGHREACGHHEHHDLRIVGEGMDLPWETEDEK